HWPFRIIASDVDHELLRSRQAEFEEVRFLVGDAEPLPFRDGAFDAVFAGELIEHLPDPRPGVAEFRRVLRPGGTLILTTPNRMRLANVADGSERPYSPDHLSELSYDEVHALLEAEGFEIRRATGLHLELLLNWFSAMPKLDRLQRGWNRPWAVPLMRLLLAAGGLWPRYALDLVFVARRR
ncbi:MAG TPA: class I SAM-dependent methyltransferase, partial [Vicinamibacteria bacterium]